MIWINMKLRDEMMMMKNGESVIDDDFKHRRRTWMDNCNKWYWVWFVNYRLRKEFELEHGPFLTRP